VTKKLNIIYLSLRITIIILWHITRQYFLRLLIGRTTLGSREEEREERWEVDERSRPKPGTKRLPWILRWGQWPTGTQVIRKTGGFKTDKHFRTHILFDFCCSILNMYLRRGIVIYCARVYIYIYIYIYIYMYICILVFIYTTLISTDLTRNLMFFFLKCASSRSLFRTALVS